VKNAVIKRQLADIGWPDPLIEEWEKVSDII
jgi:hypothetical protein